MLRMRTPERLAVAAGALAVVAGSLGCGGRVRQETFDAEMGDLRSQLQALEQRLGRRVDSLDRRYGGLQRELTELREEFNTRIAETEQAMTFNMPVHFAFDDATVRQQDQGVLDRFARVVNRYYGDAVITVEGFADPAGSEAYNIQLGQDRAEAVREYLGRAGLDGAHVKAVSYGEAHERQVVPGARGPGPEGIENRRVALVIDFGGETGDRMAGASVQER